MPDYKSVYLRYMDKHGIKYVDKNDRIVSVTYNGDNLNKIPVLVIFDEDGEGIVQLDCWEIAKFKDDKRAAGMIASNELNAKYRWVKFYVDDDGDMRAQIDAYVDYDNVGEVCSKLVQRMVSIIDKAYPVMMKYLWA